MIVPVTKFFVCFVKTFVPVVVVSVSFTGRVRGRLIVGVSLLGVVG